MPGHSSLAWGSGSQPLPGQAGLFCVPRERALGWDGRCRLSCGQAGSPRPCCQQRQAGSGLGSAACHGPAVCRAANKLEPAETGLGPAQLSSRQATGTNAPPAPHRAPAPAAVVRSPQVGSGEPPPPHAVPISCPVLSRVPERSSAPRALRPRSPHVSLCTSPRSPGTTRAFGEPQQRCGRCRKRGEEEGSGPADHRVTGVQFTREGDRGTDRAMELVSPSPRPEPTPHLPTLPSATEGARAPRPTCLAPPRLQRLPFLLSPISPALRARRPG